jgi:hypothetical protein
MSVSAHDLGWEELENDLLARPACEVLAELLRGSEALDPDSTSAAEYLEAL